MHNNEDCPCGSKINFSQCCEKYLTDKIKAETAEQLMRSRYSAYVTENESYLKNTWHEDTRPEKIDFDPEIKWIRLNIKNTEQGGVNDKQGIIEFIATYKINGRAHQLHETSRFTRNQGDWIYLEGDYPDRGTMTQKNKQST
ncbi:MAG: YchJ family metal-binding protein [Gammaproteobacteria bacterium]|nr:YchJ family metal-binding protein [Gammaproteobacteria bacterium]